MMTETPTLSEWIAFLDFHLEAGVDIALDEKPHNRFEEKAVSSGISSKAAVQDSGRNRQPEAALPRSPVQRAIPSLAVGAPDKAEQDARSQALAASSIEELHSILSSFDGCSLKFSAKNLVFADGNPQARIMLVGEAPGAEEDKQGKPFVGRSGKLLDKMLEAIGLNRSSVYITNIIPWRPPGNRTPTPQEIAICKPFILRHIELVSPQLLVTLGGPAAQTLLDSKEGILKTRGRWFSYDSGSATIPALATLHPAYLLRQPLQKRLAWRDLLSIKQYCKKENICDC